MKKKYLPSEWHEQQAVLLTWPHKDTDWAPYLNDIIDMEVEIARNVTYHEDLIIATPDSEAVRNILETWLSPTQMERVFIYQMPTNDTWARDHGAITLLYKGHSDDDNASEPTEYGNGVTLLDFRFNGWGDKFRADKDNAITANLQKMGAFTRL